MKRISSIALSFLTALGMQGVFLETGRSQVPNLSLRQRYRSAVQDAAIAESGKIVTSLVQLTPNNT